MKARRMQRRFYILSVYGFYDVYLNTSVFFICYSPKQGMKKYSHRYDSKVDVSLVLIPKTFIFL